MASESMAWFGSAVAFAVAMSATPGPNNTLVAASGARFGLVRTMPHMLGISLGFPIMLVAVALGAGSVLQAHRWLQVGLRWVGVTYLLWLAWSLARSSRQAETAEAGRRPMSLVQAALFQWVNPKAWIIAVGAVVTFTSGEGRLGQAMMLALIFAVVCLPCVFFWTSVGVGASRMLRTELALRRFDWAMAALLVASLVPVLLE